MIEQMTEPKSGRAFTYLTLSIGAVAILLLVTRSSCSGSPDLEDTPGVARQAAQAEPASTHAPGLADPGTSDAGSGERGQRVVDRDSPLRPADRDIEPERQRRLDEQHREWGLWSTEYKAALRALRHLNRVPLDERDRYEIGRARSRVFALRKSEPAGGDDGLSDTQRQQLEELPKARRAWQVRHRRELDTLRRERNDARLAGDDAAILSAEEKIRELRATQPSADLILSE
jgi:hypothetical protein